MIVALRNGNHYTSPRFWAGTTVSFVLSTFPTIALWSKYADRVVWGGGEETGFLNDKRFTLTSGDCAQWRGDANRACKD
jgi:hypothetical protein